MYTSLLPGSKKASDFSEALDSQHFLCCYFTSFFVERNAVDPNIAAPLVPQIRIISALVDLLYGSVAGILQFRYFLYALKLQDHGGIRVIHFDHQIGIAVPGFFIGKNTPRSVANQQAGQKCVVEFFFLFFRRLWGQGR